MKHTNIQNIQIVDGFFCKTAGDLSDRYFKDINFLVNDEEFKKDNYQRYLKMKHQVELFNNGCSFYDTFIKKVSNYCKADFNDVKSIIDKYIVHGN